MTGIALHVYGAGMPMEAIRRALDAVERTVAPLMGSDAELVVACLRIGRKYMDAFASGEGGSFDITELQSDLAILSGTMPYFGVLASNWKGEAARLKLAAQYHETMAQESRSKAYEAAGQKATKTQVQAEARCDVYASYVQHLTAENAANILQNSCVALQELVNTLKHVGNRLLVEMEQTPS